jgi:PhnB protein
MSKRNEFTPDGWHTLTTRIVVHKVPQFVEFLRRVFGAIGDYRPDLPTVMSIGDSTVMISEVGIRKPTPAFLYVYVEDADEIYRRAIDAGATSLEEPSVMPYGDRRGMVEDAWGNIWQIATYVRK